MRRLRTWLGGEPLLPVGVLAGLNLVDEFDRIAFATLTPEIRDSFGTNDATINSIATVAAVMILVSAGPTGRLADRMSRVVLTWFAAVLWGIASLMTGLVPTLGLLLVVRILSGIGRNANEIIHPSILTDLYPPKIHPRVFLLHRLANPVAQGSGILAGLLGGSIGWEWTFVVLAAPTFLLALLLVKVEEPPRRGIQGERRELGLLVAIGELRKVDSLRRFWITAFFLAASAIGIFQLISVYFEEIFDFGPEARGFTQFLVGVGWITGIFVGARAVDGRTDAEAAPRMAVICSGGFGVLALGALGLAASPVAWVALIATTIMSSGNGVWQAPYFSAVGRIAPEGLTGQAYASSTLFYALGALLSIPLFILGDAVSYRLAFVAVAVLALIATALARSVAPLIRSDLAARGESG
ncbi:MAG: MFS transporter [Actinomycetota bacterium]